MSIMLITGVNYHKWFYFIYSPLNFGYQSPAERAVLKIRPLSCGHIFISSTTSTSTPSLPTPFRRETCQSQVALGLSRASSPSLGAAVGSVMHGIPTTPSALWQREGVDFLPWEGSKRSCCSLGTRTVAPLPFCERVVRRVHSCPENWKLPPLPCFLSSQQAKIQPHQDVGWATTLLPGELSLSQLFSLPPWRNAVGSKRPLVVHHLTVDIIHGATEKIKLSAYREVPVQLGAVLQCYRLGADLYTHFFFSNAKAYLVLQV